MEANYISAIIVENFMNVNSIIGPGYDMKDYEDHLYFACEFQTRKYLLKTN